ncbi:hypothetical protein AtubIFM54640_005750 [Aspergillus tubingensis]|uniref:C6 finger domain protein n=1 Tax=Aspergillus niger TaxID=5061 RepID=A0A100INQ0_ASPNG|nr:C6 finger domain protein, putative [Aspergillus tubingensis]GAQ44563.1 C6 finger domain protein [Aspergillus niger]GFN17225.1 C6 finger domain protein, putative [Aspergillus tubingensis]GLA57950.1 hypothetical protein AtubIFM54640_005750 [Aspergillus tubingensis]
MPRSNGCITCKIRRKKCDEQKPSCAACMRNVLICAWGEMSRQTAKLSSANTILPRQRRRKSSSTQALSAFRSRPDSPSPPNTELLLRSLPRSRHSPMFQELRQSHPQLSRSQAAFLYTFFLHKAAQVVCIRDEPSNPFLHVLIPVAMQSDMILHALLAFSGVIYLQNNRRGHFAHAVWEQYAQVLRSLKHSLVIYSQGQNDLAVFLMITCLILCAIETTNADTHEHAFLHLRAAQDLFSAAEAHCSNTPLFSFAAEFYLYIVALLPSCTSPKDHSETMLRSEADVQLCSRILMRNQTPLVGMLCGNAFTLYQWIPQVYEISIAIHDNLIHAGVGGLPMHMCLSRLRAHSVIQSWTPEIQNDGDGYRCGLIYQLALLSLLDMSPLNERGTAEGSVSYRRQLILNFMQLLRAIPPESNHTTVLCWPLAVLGAYAEEPEDRAFVRTYLFRMVKKYNLGNMYQTIALLELVWKSQHLLDSGPRCLTTAMEIQGFRIMFT